MSLFTCDRFALAVPVLCSLTLANLTQTGELLKFMFKVISVFEKKL